MNITLAAKSLLLPFMHIETDLDVIAVAAEQKEEENENFKSFLRLCNGTVIDALVHSLNTHIEPQIDCTQCGNCCKGLMINVEDKEANELSRHLHLEREAFDNKYVEKGSGGMMIVNTIPCHFLSDSKCTVYEYRFADCRNFPNLHLPAFTKRLFATFMHYGRCPIIFNVIEALKRESHFLEP